MARVNPEKVSWSLLEVVACGALYWLAARWLSGRLPFQGVSPVGGAFLFQLLISLPLAIFPIGIVIVVRRRVLLASCFPASTAFRDAALGIQLFFIVGLLNAFASKLQLQTLLQRGEIHKLSHLQKSFYDLQRVREVLLMAVAVGVIVPICEEIFFRGFLYPALRRFLPAWLCVPLGSAVFAGFHGDSSLWPTAFLLSVVVSILFEYSGSLIGPILVHMGANLSFVMFLVDRGDLAQAMPYSLIFGAFVLMNVHFFISSRHLFAQKAATPNASTPQREPAAKSPAPAPEDGATESDSPPHEV